MAVRPSDHGHGRVSDWPWPVSGRASERAVRTRSWCDTNFLTTDMLLIEIKFTFPSSQLKFESHATHRDLRLTSCN